MLPFIIAGLTTGSVYSIAGVGLVLTYKTSGIFNFAYGAFATVSAFLFYSLNVQLGWPWPLAAFVCVFVVGPLMGLGMERVAKAVAFSGLVIRVVATVGILVAVQATINLLYGEESTRTVPQFLPDQSFYLGDTLVTLSNIIIVLFGLGSTTALFLYFRYARTGVAMRAVVDDPDLLDLSGTSPTAVRRYAWVIGSCFAAVAGLFFAPLLQLDSTALTLLVVYAFGAAAIGRFSSLPMTYVGGLVIGVAAALAAKYFTTGLLANIPAALPFLILFAVLLFARRSRQGAPSTLRPLQRSNWETPSSIQVGGGLLALVALCFVPAFADYRLTDWTMFLTWVILFLSLGLLVRTSGQVSLCHVAFMAVGAAAFGHFTADAGMPWFFALAACGLVTIPIGALLAIPAIRLTGLYLALATLGFGIVLAFMFYTQPYMFGFSGLGLIMPRPDLPGVGIAGDTAYYYVVLTITVVVTLGLVALHRGRLGRLLRALGDSPRGLATCGTSVNVTRVLVFCISAFLAAIAGALGGVAQGFVSGSSYPPLLSLTLLAILVIQPGGIPWYALIGGAGWALVPSYFPSTETGYYLEIFFGVFAVVFAMIPESKRGTSPGLARRIDQIARRPRRPDPAVQVPSREEDRSAVEPTGPSEYPVDATTLEVRELTVRYGGIVAVDGVDLTVPTGKITGLIGPNGAGKTSTFNVISGLNRASKGSVVLSGNNLSSAGAAARSRRGLGRTFQIMELFDSLTVRQNVELGREGSYASWNPLSHVLGGRKQRDLVQRSVDEAITLCGLDELADRVVGSLSTGQRRLVELARCLAGPFQLLLLDEPSSGLDRVETENFGRILRTVVERRGVGILLVEHDMSLVTQVCDYIYVLDFGKQIFEGTPGAVMSAPIVRSAYLGDEDVEGQMDARMEKASS